MAAGGWGAAWQASSFSADHAAGGAAQGHYDVGFNNPGRLDVSGNTTALAKDGIILKHHYVFYWRDPSPHPTTIQRP